MRLVAFILFVGSVGSAQDLLFSGIATVPLPIPIQTGTSYYVDTSGNDSNTGLSPAQAWATLAHATNQTYEAGDSLLLKRGQVWYEPFVFPSSGLTLDAFSSGALPVVDGGTTNRIVISCGEATNTVTRHLVIRNGGGGSGALWETSFGTNTITDCVLTNHLDDACVAAGNSSFALVQRCICGSAGDDGLTLHTTASMKAENCTITNCFQGINNSGTDMQMTVNDCTFADNVADVDSLDGTTATFNRCRFNGFRTGAQWAFLKANVIGSLTFNYCIFDASGGDDLADPFLGVEGPDHYFANCVFYGGTNRVGSIVIAAAGVLTATNCIFSDWWRAAYVEGAFNADHCIFYNLAIKNVTSNTSEVSTSDPLFVAPLAGNFHLQAGSPALNAGVYIGLTVDADGVTVANPPEVGAYEKP